MGLKESFIEYCGTGRMSDVQFMMEQHYDYIRAIYDIWNKGLKPACKNGHMEIVRYLVARARYWKTPVDWSTGLAYACMGGHRDVIRFILESVTNEHYHLHVSRAFENAIMYVHFEAAFMLLPYITDNSVVHVSHLLEHLCKYEYHENPYVARLILAFLESQFSILTAVSEYVETVHLAGLLDLCAPDRLRALLPRYTKQIDVIIAQHEERHVLLMERVIPVLATIINQYAGFT